MKDEMMGNKMSLTEQQIIPNEKLLQGSITDKYPVVLNDGKTVIFISDKSKEPEIRRKYESLNDKKYFIRSSRHHK